MKECCALFRPHLQPLSIVLRSRVGNIVEDLLQGLDLRRVVLQYEDSLYDVVVLQVMRFLNLGPFRRGEHSNR